MNKLDLLRTFLRVKELASFTQAADSLGLPKANVSDSIRALEDLLGTRLLHRTTRKVQATQDGLALYERAQGLLADMEALEAMFRQRETALTGKLRVDLPTLTARRVVVPRLGEFLGAHPLLEIEVSSTDRRVDPVREGFDCVLRIGRLHDSSLIVRTLGAMQLVNCASPGYLSQYGVPETLADLEHHRLVHYTQVLGSRSPGFEYCEQGVDHQVTMGGNVTVNNAEAYEAAALGGLGLIQVPVTAIRGNLETGQLVTFMPNYVPAPMPVSLLYPSRRHLPERVRVFMAWLTSVLESELGGSDPGLSAEAGRP